MAASIGEQLRLAREERGIGLREICEQTRISVHYLEAIEANDYKRLPGGVFNRSFIKAYAKCVGYDEREAIEGYTRYLREHGESTDDVNTHPHHSKVYTDTPATRSPILTVILAILILAILTAAALAALHWFQRRAAVTLPRNAVITSLRPLRISAFSAFRSDVNAEKAEIRRERRDTRSALSQIHSPMYNALT
jgi:cytoskeletal protein RodZ